LVSGLVLRNDSLGFQTMRFGDVDGKRVQLSSLGRIAQESSMAIRWHFARVPLQESTVMPNHAHGIRAIVQALVVAQHVAPLQTTDRGWE
jgi:hypothetical protein